jgi:hypothetical protein
MRDIISVVRLGERTRIHDGCIVEDLTDRMYKSLYEPLIALSGDGNTMQEAGKGWRNS